MSSPIVFFGSGPVAAASLRLLAASFTIEAVVTKPRAAGHRGSVPVLEVAAELQLPVLTAATKPELTRLIAGHRFASPAAVLIDFGIIVEQAVIDHFPKGIINSHFSLLPEWRGADPISFAILSGQPRTGVSLMLLTAGLDEGPLLAQAPYDLPPDITGPQLTADLVELSEACLGQLLPLWLNGEVAAAPQAAVTIAASRQPSYSRKLTKADGRLDFKRPAAELEGQIRAFLDWPKSRIDLAGIEAVVTKAHVKGGNGSGGKLYREGQEFGIYTSDGILVIDELKPAGRPAMPATAFLAGYGHRILK